MAAGSERAPPSPSTSISSRASSATDASGPTSSHDTPVLHAAAAASIVELDAMLHAYLGESGELDTLCDAEVAGIITSAELKTLTRSFRKFAHRPRVPSPPRPRHAATSLGVRASRLEADFMPGVPLNSLSKRARVC